MLLYTFNSDNNEITATFSGRFSFVHFSDHDVYNRLLQLCSSNDLRELWELNDNSPFIYRVLAHEHTHKHAFALSDCGLILNGWRFWVRSQFLMTDDTNALIRYYRARTIFFHHTYEYHEEIADFIDTLLLDGSFDPSSDLRELLPTDLTSEVEAVDQFIFELWKEYGVSPSLKFLHKKLGRGFQNNFALMLSYVDAHGHFVEGGLADQGVTNDVGTIRADSSMFDLLLKPILQHSIVLPLYAKESFETYFEWFWIGQRAQFEMLQKLTGISFDDYYTRYMLPVCQFVLEWAGTPLIFHSCIIELVEDSLVMERGEFETKWSTFLEENKSNDRFERFFTFFYLHGN